MAAPVEPRHAYNIVTSIQNARGQAAKEKQLKTMWTDSDIRGEMLDFYNWYQGLSGKDRQKAINEEWKKVELNAPAQPDLDHLFDLIKGSFSEFIQDGRNRKALIGGQGGDKKLASFLAIPDIYEMIKPRQLMEQALQADNMEDVRALGLFIITNFGTEFEDHPDPDKSMNAMFATIMKSFAEDDAPADDYTPKNHQFAQKQGQFATAVVSLALTRTNPLKLDEKLLISITAAAQYDPKDHLTRYKVFNGLVKLVYAIAERFFTIPNYWNLTDRLHSEIVTAIDQRKTLNQRLRHEAYNKQAAEEDKRRDLRLANNVERTLHREVNEKHYKQHFRKPYWHDEVKKGKWLVQKRQEVREREVQRLLNLPYPYVAERILAIAKQRGIATPHFDARVAFEEERKVIAMRHEWQQPYDGRNGWKKGFENDPVEGIPDVVTWGREAYPEPHANPVHDTLTKHREAIARCDAGLECSLDEFVDGLVELNNMRLPPEQARLLEQESSHEAAIRAEITALNAIEKELLMACVTTGLYLEDLDHVSRVTGLTLVQLTTLAEVTRQKFSEFPDIPNIPRQNHRFLPTAIIRLAAQAHTEGTVELPQLDQLPNATRDYTIDKLVGVAVVTGYSLQQLEFIATQTGISYFKVAESLKTGGSNQPADGNPIRVLKLIVLEAGQRAGLPLSISQQQFLEEDAKPKVVEKEGMVTVTVPAFGQQQQTVTAPAFGQQQKTTTVPAFGQQQQTVTVPAFGTKPKTWHTERKRVDVVSFPVGQDQLFFGNVQPRSPMAMSSPFSERQRTEQWVLDSFPGTWPYSPIPHPPGKLTTLTVADLEYDELSSLESDPHSKRRVYSPLPLSDEEEQQYSELDSSRDVLSDLSSLPYSPHHDDTMNESWLDDIVFNTTAEGTPFSSPYRQGAPGKTTATVTQPGSAPARVQQGLFRVHESSEKRSSTPPVKKGNPEHSRRQSLDLSSLESSRLDLSDLPDETLNLSPLGTPIGQTPKSKTGLQPVQLFQQRQAAQEEDFLDLSDLDSSRRSVTTPHSNHSQ